MFIRRSLRAPFSSLAIPSGHTRKGAAKDTASRQSLTYPHYQRKFFCISISVIVFIILTMVLPKQYVEMVPMIQAATIIHGVIVGWAISMVGHINYLPTLRMRLHPLLRGGILTAFIHLDYTIYTWPEQYLFWKMMICAAAFGATLDLLATELFGDGKALAKDMAK